MLFGGHCSGGIKGSLDRAAELEADCMQLFVQSPRAWRFPQHDPADLERFRAQRAGSAIEAVLVHALYLINLATPDETIYEKSVATLEQTVATAGEIGAEGVVVHVGSHLGAGPEAGFALAAPALERVLEQTTEHTWLLLENSAGAGGTIGRSVEELAELVERLGRHPRLGVCLDSCHLYASGYDVGKPAELDRLLDELDASIGLDRLRALHVNDSAAPLGSNRDRHANLGEGLIGSRLTVFVGHPALQMLPAVLEVPGPAGHGPDAEDVSRLRDLNARGRRAASRRSASAARRP